MKDKKDIRKKREKGSATIEAIIAFTGFLFVIFTILNVLNFCRAQVLISNAVDSAAKEMSEYAYFYKMSGLQKFNDEIYASGKQGATNLDEVIDTVNVLYGSVGKAAATTSEELTKTENLLTSGQLTETGLTNSISKVQYSVEDVWSNVSNVENAAITVVDNPLVYIKSMVAIAGAEALDKMKSHAIAAPLAKVFTSKHFATDTLSADEVLQSLGVKDGLAGMNFNMSTIFTGEHPDEIHIVVYYRLRLIQLLNWETLEVDMCKEAVVRAWLGGDAIQQKVVSSNVSVPKDPVEEEKPEKTEAPEEDSEELEEEQEEEQQENQTDYTGSYWYLPEVEEDEPKKLYAFVDTLLDTYNVQRNETIMKEMVGRDAANQAYGMGYYTSYDAAKNSSISAYLHSMECLEALEDLYVRSNGESGYEPGSTISYVYVVYVPENIPDSELESIKHIYDDIDLQQAIKKDAPIDIPIVVEVVKAGGNYDYGGDD